MIWKLLAYTAILATLTSCSNPQPGKQEIVGTWRSVDGATLKLTANDSVLVTGYPLSVSNPSFKGFLNGSGTWKSIKDPNARWWSIELSITSSEFIPEAQSNKIGIELYVVRNGSVGNGPNIENLFIWKGDPDADNRYEFVK